MNDFHILSLCVQNKDVAGAMRVLRDKSEFAARKILEKLKVRVTSQTGRAFWHHVQDWLLMACRQENTPNESRGSRPSSTPSDTRADQSCCPGYGQSAGTDRHAGRPHQHPVPDARQPAFVCGWPDGLPPVHAYLGDKRAAHTGTAPGEGKPSVEMGRHNPACIQPGFCASPSVVGTEHSFRVRRCHATACPSVPVRKKRADGWRTAAGHPSLAAEPGQLWPGGYGSGHRHGHSHGRADVCRAAHGGYRVRAVTVLSERGITPAESAGRHAAVRHPPHTGFPHYGHLPEHSVVPGGLPALYAPAFFLHRLCRPSAGSAHPDATLVREPPFTGRQRGPGILRPCSSKSMASCR